MFKKIKYVWSKIPAKYKSVTAWLTLVPTIVALGDSLDLWNVIGLPKTTFMQGVSFITTLVNAFGAFNNPDKRDKF